VLQGQVTYYSYSYSRSTYISNTVTVSRVLVCGTISLLVKDFLKRFLLLSSDRVPFDTPTPTILRAQQQTYIMMKYPLFRVLSSVVNLFPLLIIRTNSFLPQTKYHEIPSRHNRFSHGRAAVHDDPTSTTTGQWILYEDIPTEFTPLLTAVTETCMPRAAKTDQQAHDAFRYEWGTWSVPKRRENRPCMSHKCSSTPQRVLI
jgi:hypothetical protein